MDSGLQVAVSWEWAVFFVASLRWTMALLVEERLVVVTCISKGFMKGEPFALKG